ncbi:hypothetical protein GJ744_002898 [Endocarpon pusillum]|uniref:L-ornithine N(5)-monooxygenase n=1 Tax=Endocarpon pusillum TaxID=364733 RepID=A0A8H7AAM5_9EURO|nr:hypothetical protein GJ744_002898 [Endocarpon pusillum]
MSPFLEVTNSGSITCKPICENGEKTLLLQSEHNGFLQKPKLCPAEPQEIHNLLCIGFGPASLAIAVALNDALDNVNCIDGKQPTVCFLEKQHQFAWHAGMLLPGSKMQISFIKDLATLRDPRSEFTFLNYLHRHHRLVQFSNLGTFLPSRAEFEDYLRWCADHFTDVVEYGQEVLEVSSNEVSEPSTKIDYFLVSSRNSHDGSVSMRKARNVVIAVGGQPHIPVSFPSDEPRVIHSSQYRSHVPTLLPDKTSSYSIAVVGSGQSAAEIFRDLHYKYPSAMISLIIRDTALRPSDDSPFVNEVFDPERTDHFYNSLPAARADALRADRGTNYSVVRLELLEQIYHDLYEQRVKQPDDAQWQRRILPSREIIHVTKDEGSKCGKLSLTIKNISPLGSPSGSDQEMLEVDAVVLATGYVRNAHEKMLKSLEHLRPPADNNWRVRRDYKVEMDRGKVSADAGIWLQGCNESTHGLSDTLLSTLATRGGEMVDSIFGTAYANGE